jgi:two-component system, NarL family, response regulator
MQVQRPLRIFAVDGDPLVRHGLRAMLDETDDLVLSGQAGSVAAALVASRKNPPDVVLSDAGLPDSAGVQGVRQLRAALPDARVVVFTGDTAPDLVRECLDAGAVGYLLKTGLPAVLCDALRQVGRGVRVVDPALIDGLLGDSPRQLTPREVDVLTAVSHGLTNRQAATQLGTRESTVKTLLARAMGKLDASDRTHAVAMGLRRGLIS